MGNHARTAVAMIAAALFTAAAGGCSNSSGGSSPSPAATPPPSVSPAPSAVSSPAGKVLITIKDFAFEPPRPAVAPGTLITVVNKDNETHTLTATGSKAFDTGKLALGQTVTFTAPGKAGSYPFICTIHPYMKGTLTVR